MYRYAGSLTDVGDVKLNKFGQLVEFPEELAQTVILGGGQILPTDDAVWKDFTEQELSIYANPLTHAQANASFLAKKKKTQIACSDRRAQLLAKIERQRLEADLKAQPFPAPERPALDPPDLAAHYPEAEVAPAPEKVPAA
jgi:hypothetical protein